MRNILFALHSGTGGGNGDIGVASVQVQRLTVHGEEPEGAGVGVGQPVDGNHLAAAGKVALAAGGKVGNMVDAVGGIDIELTAAEARYLNSKKADWNFTEGENHLSGAAALNYARARKIGGAGDFDRSKRQRTVITAMLGKLKEMSLIDLYNLVDMVLPMIYTDMSNAEIVAMAMELAPMLQDLEIVSQRIPIDGGYRMTMINEMSVLLPDLKKNREFLVETIGDM